MKEVMPVEPNKYPTVKKGGGWAWILLCLFLSGCAYGMYDQQSGLFWVDQSPLQKQIAGDAMRWQQFYQMQNLYQMQQLNNTLRMRPSLGY